MNSSITPEFRKAQRLYLKSTKGRNPEIEKDWTPFRAAEKRFKARFPPLDLSDVLDLACLDEHRTAEIRESGWCGTPNASKAQRLSGSVNAYTIPDIPGLVVLPSFISHEQQRELVTWSLCDQARSPNPTNLDTHYHIPPSGLWNAHLSNDHSPILPRSSTSNSLDEQQGSRKLVENDPANPQNFSTMYNTPKPDAPPSSTAQQSSPSALLPKLRWANIGWYYHWGTKQYDFKRGKAPIDDNLQALCQSAVSSIPWEDVYGSLADLEWPDSGDTWQNWKDSYEPDAGIVNFYQTKDTLMAHVDRSEVCATSPLVSVSLGNAAVFLIGGQTRDAAPTPILLRSGDVVIMSGPICRRAYHGVPRILDNSLPAHFSDDWEPYHAFMHSCRININVRQVFPKGFNPATLLESEGKEL